MNNILGGIGACPDDRPIIRQAVVDIAEHGDAKGHEDDVRPLFGGEAAVMTMLPRPKMTMR